MTANPTIVQGNCALCKRPPWEGVKTLVTSQNEVEITCHICGTYMLAGPDVIEDSLRWEADLRLPLSCATRQATESGNSLKLTRANTRNIAYTHSNTRVGDNRDRLLQIIARRASRPMKGAQFILNIDFTLIDCFDQREFEWYVEWLKRDELVHQTGAGHLSATLTLSPKGWTLVQPPPQIGGTPGRCFVAMWFSADLRDAYERGIALAVSAAGYLPVRIDAKEHNNEIPDEIIAEIRNSEFVVADFTGQRGGVYYEAGFAMGLGRPVVWCCRKDEIDHLHFDTSHKNHVVWSTPEDLRSKLFRRIRATILPRT